MVEFLKLDWWNFLKDFCEDPGMMLGRTKDILAHGTGEGKKKRILAALRAADANLRQQFAEEIRFVLQHETEGFQIFPYPAGGIVNVDAGFDKAAGMPYVVHDSKRLYFPSRCSVGDAEAGYRSLLEWEDILGRGNRAKSPHRYTDSMHAVDRGDIVLDVGCAEGLFALDNVDKAKHVYLFEPLSRWEAPVNATFAPFADKTTFAKKLVGDRTGGDMVRLSDAVKSGEDDVYFLKMDVEGWEGTILSASRDFLTSNKVKVSCCAYHRQEDERNLTQLLASMGFSVRVSDGYMLPLLGEIKPPYFRRGVIYGRNF